MYQSMIRVLNASETKDEEQILNIIAEGKEGYPKDYVLNIEEFNYSKGNNEKAQLALENAIESNPTNKILHLILVLLMIIFLMSTMKINMRLLFNI